MFRKSPATPEQLRYRLGLRSSNAAVPHRNKKKYNRKNKHTKGWDNFEDQDKFIS